MFVCARVCTICRSVCLCMYAHTHVYITLCMCGCICMCVNMCIWCACVVCVRVCVVRILNINISDICNEDRMHQVRKPSKQNTHIKPSLLAQVFILASTTPL